MKKQIFPVVIGVIKKNGKYLLTKRQSPKKEWNKWQFPGGGLEFFETLEDAVKREIKEETGVEILKVEFIPKVFEIIRPKDKWHGLLFVFRCFPKENNFSVRINSEASEYGWFSFQEILKLDSLLGTKEIASFIEENGF
jgi:8-oxo-dGTP diphosphatase